MKQFPTIELTRKQQIFLKGYTPAKRGITSMAEIKMVCEALNLYELSNDDMQAMRNTVVQFYSEIRKQLLELTNGNWNKPALEVSEAIMSVTAVIDDIKYKRGMTV